MKILAFSTKQSIQKKNVLARFSESKGGHSRLWNKILYVTRDESRFFSWVVTALATRFFPRVFTGKICYFRPLLHNVLSLKLCESVPFFVLRAGDLFHIFSSNYIFILTRRGSGVRITDLAGTLK